MVARTRRSRGSLFLLGYGTARPPPDFECGSGAVSFNRVNTVKDSGSVRRATTAAAAAVAVFSLACLVVVLVLYGQGITPWPPLLAVGLYGLPAAFLLILVLVGLSWAERRRS
jgi:hypothetical protein